MVGSYSPHGDAGGTLHFPSPTHIHHVDPASAFRQLRRSLSRSPSKGPAFRLVTSKSTSPSPSSPLSPSREQPPNRSISASIISPPHVFSPSPLAVPHGQSARKIRPATRKLSPMRNISRSNSTQRSPKKRTLSESKDDGNATPRSSADSSDDQENRRSESPLGDPMPDVVFKTSAPIEESSPFAPPRATAKFEKGNSWGTKSSPLKRSDGIMNLDQANLGSPSRKRRSLHGGVFSADFNIFDHEAAFDGHFDAMDTSSSLDHLSALPKRTSSLRKTTLQQRHDKPLFARSKPNTDLALDFSTPGQASQKNRFRMSLDSALPSMPRDSPFSSQGSLPNASAHPPSQPGAKQNGSSNGSQPQRHPLSRTISQSTSNSSMAEDSPTHVPVRLPEPRRTFVDFSKSLPVGTARPGPQDGESSSQGVSFATPKNYKLVKPFAPAFMSTGLISKRHKNMEESQTGFGLSLNQMPDTPCKRHSLAEIPSPKVSPEDTFTKGHHARHSFGTPSTPFNPHVSRPAPGTFGKGVSIFGSSFGNGGIPRRGSFLSADGEEDLQSPPKQGDSQSSTDFEIPPTPTKQANAPGSVKQTPLGGSATRKDFPSPGFGASGGAKTLSYQPEQNCKLISFGTPSGSADGDSDGLMQDSPLAALGFRSLSTMPRSFTQAHLLRNSSKSPTPLGKASFSAPAFLSRRSKAKPGPLSPASPLNDRFRHLSPHTPKESMIPPDPSGLSISARADERQRPKTATTSSASTYSPATPTTHRDSFASFNKSTSSMTPSHALATVEVDPVLTTMFDKVELIGTGEFSQVYRVSQKQELKKARSYFSIPLGLSSPAKTPLSDRVWAVKKSRHTYIGPKDRHRKLQEVNALKALGHSDHTIQLFDIWEDQNRLYIQTEYCEEGSLDSFLDQVGRKARLDDFRIWKIMLELSLGLKHIHDSGFIHLDLKPANVLITFEGCLKIADFGMATRWPAQPGIDGEGDREYIGPEILMGQFDKPGDVFALGLVMLEIAANVMLPDNGASWQRLRSGDMSDVPSLTWSSNSSNSNVFRDSSGKPLSKEESVEDFYGSDSASDYEFDSPKLFGRKGGQHKKKASFQLYRSGELVQPPAFMTDPNDPEALDNLVRWMISPRAADRPIVGQILATMGVQWAEKRRRAGATIFEGNWGPADEVLADDAEMIDV